MSGQWSGQGTQRRWQRPGSRRRNIPGDTERGEQLFELLKHESFWCDTCGACHPLIEHRDCREQFPFRSAWRGAT